MVLLQHDRPGLADPTAMWSAVLPAHAWAEVLTTPTITVHARGAAGTRIRLMAMTGGVRRVLVETQLDDDWAVDVPTAGHTWMWIEGDVEEVSWSCAEDVALPRVTAVVPTFGRPREVVTQARALLAAVVVGRVVVVDQAGTLADDPVFSSLRQESGDRLILLTQDNLGGSGGYARGMIESLRWPDDAVFLSDDDATIHPESLRRMVVFQALARERGRACVVATGMRSAERPASLVSLAERVEPSRFWWTPADGLREPLDLADGWPEEWDRLLATHPPDYAGWWGALLPPGTVSDLGLPAPFFLKWDDAEYGLRARRRGYLVRALPGVAVTHPTWAAKRTAAGWHSLLMHRNRLATAAAYGAGRGVLLDSFVHQVKHVLSLQYTTAELWQQAARTMLSGPRAWLGSDLLRARSDAQALIDRTRSPDPRATDATAGRRRPVSAVAGAVRSVLGLWRPAARDGWTTTLPAAELTWRDALGVDRVVLDHGDEQTPDILQRDPARARALMADILLTHVRLALRWGRLRAQYRQALPQVVTTGYWTLTIGIEDPGR